MALDRLETLGPGVRTALRSRLGLTDLNQTRWQEIVEELLVAPPANGWRPLRPTQNGFLEIHLGGLFSRWRPGSVGAQVNDTFNRADGNLNGSTTSDAQATWTEYLGTLWTVTTNRAQVEGATAGAAEEARVELDLATDNHYAQIVATSLGSDNFVIGTLCRKDSTTTRTFYGFRTDKFGTSRTYLFKLVSGTETQLGSDGTAAVANDTVRVEASGTSITGKVNGVARVGPVTDSAISGNLRTGLHGYVGGTTATGDNFEAADLAAAAAAPRGHGALLSGFRNQVIQRV